ncbi:hypothetical protein NLG97_g1456 [Lecanicillium saksenae]|uniref:Uncharacterized protein n=1 Tax=Lecanicillium saksenae TaxID=468837 RepID=A0ACC1R6E2_9HYPO|nr:hypothetical protein NLG97_g1456 [Lecanicillium saksenae]
MKSSPLTLLAAATTAAAAAPRNVMYFDQWHTATLPPKDVTAGVTHVITAFAPDGTFNWGSSYTPFMSLSDVRALFDQGTKVCMAIGGWGDTTGFGTAAASDESRKRYAKNVADALNNLGYDCVDVDWEYPGGNGEDYKTNPNSGKTSEIETYPLLLKEIKAVIGDKELSIAVPGKVGDMIAFTADQVPKIAETVDFVNVMTYDLMNRRDNVTNHHTSVSGSLETVETYLSLVHHRGRATCDQATGCATAVLEDANGNDTQKSGAITFEKENYSGDFLNAMNNGKADTEKGGQWYWDAAKKVYWTWDTPDFIAKKMTDIVKAKGLGGVMAWSLAQDSHDWSHIKALQSGIKNL